MAKIIPKIRYLIQEYGGIKEQRLNRVSFPCGLMRNGDPYEIVLYLKPIPSMALLNRVQEDLEYLRKPH